MVDITLMQEGLNAYQYSFKYSSAKEPQLMHVGNYPFGQCCANVGEEIFYTKIHTWIRLPVKKNNFHLKAPLILQLVNPAFSCVKQYRSFIKRFDNGRRDYVILKYMQGIPIRH